MGRRGGPAWAGAVRFLITDHVSGPLGLVADQLQAGVPRLGVAAVRLRDARPLFDGAGVPVRLAQDVRPAAPGGAEGPRVGSVAVGGQRPVGCRKVPVQDGSLPGWRPPWPGWRPCPGPAAPAPSRRMGVSPVPAGSSPEIISAAVVPASGPIRSAAPSRACRMAGLARPLMPNSPGKGPAIPRQLPSIPCWPAAVLGRLGPRGAPRTGPVSGVAIPPQSRRRQVSARWLTAPALGMSGMSATILLGASMFGSAWPRTAGRPLVLHGLWALLAGWGGLWPSKWFAPERTQGPKSPGWILSVVCT